MTIYIAGPMTGYEDWNFPAFNEAAKTLRDYCNAETLILNPAETNDGDPNHADGRKYYIRVSIENVLCADMLVLLDGWRESKGALLEVSIARELEIPCIEYSKFMSFFPHGMLAR